MTRQGKGIEFDKNDFDPGKDRAKIDLTKVDPYASRWNTPFSGGWDQTNETRDYFDRLLNGLKKANPQHTQQFRLIPVGHVFADLDQKMKGGMVPGYQSIYEVYSDSIHMGRLGSYIAGATAYATISSESAVGLNTKAYGDIDPKIAAIVQKTIDASLAKS
jgi:hypothetical protein